MSNVNLFFYKYLLKNWKILDLELTEHPWPDLYDEFKCYDYSISLSWKGQTAIGRGTDKNSFTALMKAAGEAVERWCQTNYLWQSSSGLAVHHDLKTAIDSAQNELIERDAFYRHYLNRLPFLQTQDCKDYLQKKLSLKENLSFLGVELFIVELNSISKNIKTVFICAIGTQASPSFGVVLGLASSPCFKQAADKAMSECLRNLSPFLFKQENKKSLLPSFYGNIFWKAKIHHLCAQQKGYGKYFKKTFLTKEGKRSYQVNKKIEIHFNSSRHEIKLPNHCSLKLIKTESQELQNHYVGALNRNKIKAPRVNDPNTFYSYLNLNQVLHPLA